MRALKAKTLKILRIERFLLTPCKVVQRPKTLPVRHGRLSPDPWGAPPKRLGLVAAVLLIFNRIIDVQPINFSGIEYQNLPKATPLYVQPFEVMTFCSGFLRSFELNQYGILLPSSATSVYRQGPRKVISVNWP